jgi:hypothetical protein
MISTKGRRLFSFVAVPDGASEANAPRVLRHFHRQAGLAHAGSAPEHDQRAVAAQSAIDGRLNRVTFGFRPTKAVRSASENGEASSTTAEACGRSIRSGARSPLEVGCSAGSTVVAANSHEIGKSGSGW